MRWWDFTRFVVFAFYTVKWKHLQIASQISLLLCNNLTWKCSLLIYIYLRWSPISIWDQDCSTLVYNKLSCFLPSRCRFFLNIFQFIALQGWTQNRTCFLPSTLFFFLSLIPGSCSSPAGRLAVTHGLPWSVTGPRSETRGQRPFYLPLLFIFAFKNHSETLSHRALQYSYFTLTSPCVRLG